MLTNNFQILLNELDNVSFSVKNLVNNAKKYKEKISQVPKNIIPYVKRYGPTVALCAGATAFCAGAILYSSNIAYMAAHPMQSNVAETYAATKGAIIMIASTLSLVPLAAYQKTRN